MNGFEFVFLLFLIRLVVPIGLLYRQRRTDSQAVAAGGAIGADGAPLSAESIDR